MISVPILTYLVWRLTHTTRTGLGGDPGGRAGGLQQRINVPVYKMIAFVISAILAGYAGALETHINFYIDPLEYSVTRTIQILTFAVVGGTTNVIGPIVGAVFLTSLRRSCASLPLSGRRQRRHPDPRHHLPATGHCRPWRPRHHRATLVDTLENA